MICLLLVMGIIGLWQLLKDKGYIPTLHHHLPQSSPDATTACRVDVLGTYFQEIKNAYTKHPPDIAHRIMEQELLTAGSKQSLWVYLDGSPSKEKESTHAQREATRVESGERAQVLLDDLQQKIEDRRSVRKQDFKQVGSMISKTFYWSLDSRNAFAAYLTQQGWSHVIQATTEADLAIARDCQPGDVVVTRDSDLLIYPSVTRVYRAISRNKYLEYDVQDLSVALGMSRVQLTVLGVVSRNDYTSNIPSLGSKSNYKIVKSLSAQGRIIDTNGEITDKGSL